MSTGDMVGLIEVVTNAETVARIQAKCGIISGVTRDDVLYSWMKRIESDSVK